MLSLKNVIDSYSSKLEDYKLNLDTLIANFEIIFDKDQGNYFQFMTNKCCRSS